MAVFSGAVQVKQNGSVARVIFSSEKANALDSETLKALSDALRSLGQDPLVLAIGLESEGQGAFCAGASFEEFQRLSSPSEAKDFFLGFARVMLAMRDARQFILTKVQGKAVGGALGLIAASDLVFASIHAEVRLSELSIGIGPFVIGPFVERRIGKPSFSLLTVESAWKDARWALQQGLFSQLRESSSELEQDYLKELERLAALRPEAVFANKRMLWEDFLEPAGDLEAKLESRAQTVANLLLSQRS